VSPPSSSVHDRRHPVHAAHLAVLARQRREIVIGQRIVPRAAVLDPVKLAERLTGHMRHVALVLADADVHLRFAEIDRLELSVNVGDMDQRDVAVGLELQQLVLRQPLLRGQLRPVAETAGAHQRRGCHAGLKKIAARDHLALRVVRFPLTRSAQRGPV
jgi:hypothetical protein